MKKTILTGLNKKELNVINKATEEFDKTPWGKKTKLFTTMTFIFSFISMLSLTLISFSFGEDPEMAFTAIGLALMAQNAALMFINHIQYQSMAMNYTNSKK